ncbi:hypothetical protein E2C01_022446 [Portunus trituberculatus]|uniref:Uncharacterized protein n=1 Tax=Portunus trituberculatus TaxID=210409 RepID=A0A5B7E7Q9_PORTR|nr:hypothetical protein [Portunus trituberculatus]
MHLTPLVALIRSAISDHRAINFASSHYRFVREYSLHIHTHWLAGWVSPVLNTPLRQFYRSHRKYSGGANISILPKTEIRPFVLGAANYM